ncbi:hypothetical protein AB0N65_00975 [Paenarthrobacter sp. NPDC089322]|uniref:hypothetical protein n=1 Tax=Paenarthrobacter sp. NPDC089322 TaxID=3155065 RepID=UPI00343448CB
MKLRRIRLVAVGVGVADPAYDGGTSPDAGTEAPVAGTPPDATAGLGGSSVVGPVLHEVSPAKTEAPKALTTARLLGAEKGVAEWSPHMAVPQGSKNDSAAI